MRFFEKISFEQFKKDISNDEKLYNEYQLPKRSTNNSAGYDFQVLQDYVLKPKEIIKIPTGIKANMEEDKFLLLAVRSGVGFKYNVRMCNQVGIIDKDYYNISDNEGHIFIKIQNEGTEDFVIKKFDKVVQGIFMKYYLVDNEEEITTERKGGLGSTTKRRDVE